MVIVPGADVSDLAADLDVMAEIGAAQINTLSFDRTAIAHSTNWRR